MSSNSKHLARATFKCPELNCTGDVTLTLLGQNSDMQTQCPSCHRSFIFDDAFANKLHVLQRLIIAIRNAEDILSSTHVAVTTPNGEVKVPYKLLLSRLNTHISLDVQGKKIDFCFWIEPTTESFR